MNIFRHNENGMLYTIEHVVNDIHFLNGNAHAGIYASPYKHGKYPVGDFKDTITHTLGNFRMGIQTYYDPEKFVRDTFTKITDN